MPRDRFQVAGWIVDARALEISQGRETRRLEPRVMDLLVCLAQRPGEVLTRQELEEMLWGRVVVGYDSLVRAVTKLRQAFDDDIHHPRIIETVPKVGYRLIAEVEPVRGRRTPGRERADRPWPRLGQAGPPVAAAAILLLLATAWLLWWQPWGTSIAPQSGQQLALPLPDKPSVAVLPMVDLSENAAHDRLADALTDLMITEFSRFPELFVISRNSSLVYRHKPTAAKRIAQELGVRYLVEGSVQRSENRVRITVQLIDAVNDTHVWAERYDRRLRDLFAVQDEIVRTVVATIHGRVFRAERQRIRELEPDFLRAYEYAERGNEYYLRWTEEDTRRARELVERAIEIDPTYLRSYRILTAIYRDGHRMGWLDMSREKALRLARETAERALTIDSSNYHAHWAMGVYYREAGYQRKALEEFEKALELNPNNALLLWETGEPLAYMGRFEESIARYRQAMRLNPHHQDNWYWNLAWTQYAAGHCREALRSMQQMQPLPNMARRELAPIYVCLGEVDKARAVMDEFRKHEPDYTLADYRRLFEKVPLLDELRDRNLADLRTAGLPEATAKSR